MVSNIPFASYQPEWKDYLKTHSSILGWNFWKVTLSFTLHPEIPKFSVKWQAPQDYYCLPDCSDKLSLSFKIFADDTKVFASTNNLPLKLLWTSNLKRWKNVVM